MPMAPSITQLRAMTDEELAAACDGIAEGTVVGLNFYRDELARREMLRLTTSVRRLTWAIAIMTGVMTMAACVSTWAVLAS